MKEAKMGLHVSFWSRSPYPEILSAPGRHGYLPMEVPYAKLEVNFQVVPRLRSQTGTAIADLYASRSITLFIVKLQL